MAVSRRRRSARPKKSPGNLSSPPAYRRLKVFSLDPAADTQLESSLISRSVLQVPWEPLQPGPTGEYLEIVDVDPSSGCVYDPVDLTQESLLAQDGLSPSTGNPQFHQQMVYAVAMKTIANFEQVLGRKILWAERRRDEHNKLIKKPEDRYVQHLRIYPHALRQQNAYYSPAKGAILFGYFNAPTTDPRNELPGGLVFTCLSHDIVAHEMTHAILDGLHRRLLDTSNQDMLAFHEAFADIVAIFQHFTLPGLLLDQIQRTRGNLRTNSLLAGLAIQFARATGKGDALRNALGKFTPEGLPIPPDPSLFGRTFEPHARGAILVAAVFDAFVRMYDNRVADLRRIATGGTGVLPEGDIHPDLARRFAEEATDLSQRVLNICIRAIDYLPPVDVTIGDYLRALITSDADFYPDDPKRYRLAFIEAFRNHGIYPLDVRALAEDALRWKRIDEEGQNVLSEMLPPPAILRTMCAAYDSREMAELLSDPDGEENGDPLHGLLWKDFQTGNFDAAANRFLAAAWTGGNPDQVQRDREVHGERYPRYLMERLFAQFLHGWISGKARTIKPAFAAPVGSLMGLDIKALAERNQRSQKRLAADAATTDFPSGIKGVTAPLEVHAVRPTVRLRPDGRSKVELLVVLVQRKTMSLLSDSDNPKSVMKGPDGKPLTFPYRGGSTMIIDPEAGTVSYSVSKNLLSEQRLRRQMEFLRKQIAEHGTSAINRFGLSVAARADQRNLEPFALAHSHVDEGETY